MFTHISSLLSSVHLSISIFFMDTLEKTFAALRLMCLGRLPRLSSMFDALLTFLRKEPLQSSRNDTTSTLLSNEQGKYPILTNSTYIHLSFEFESCVTDSCRTLVHYLIYPRRASTHRLPP